MFYAVFPIQLWDNLYTKKFGHINSHIIDVYIAFLFRGVNIL